MGVSFQKSPLISVRTHSVENRGFGAIFYTLKPNSSDYSPTHYKTPACCNNAYIGESNPALATSMKFEKVKLWKKTIFTKQIFP